MNNVLICVSGLTPQIVTEAFYCLSVQKNIPIAEIYIITTTRGKRVIEGKDDAPQTPKVKLIDEIKNLCDDYNLKYPKFKNSNEHIITAKEESVELHDVKFDKDNILFPNRVTKFIKNKTSNPKNVLYCCISGGRKSMSVHLANALTLFGRESDKIVHVITSEENEFKDFYPKTIKQDKDLIISEIPFVRLRSVISPDLSKNQFKAKNYIDFVEFTQNRVALLSSDTKLLVNTLTREISFGEKNIRLEPLQFAIYFKFIEKSLEPKKSISINQIGSKEFGKEVKMFLDEYIPSYHLQDSMRNPWWQRGFDAESFRSKRSKINKQLVQLFEDENYLDLFKISSIKVYGNSSYKIKAPKNKFSIIYQQ